MELWHRYTGLWPSNVAARARALVDTVEWYDEEPHQESVYASFRFRDTNAHAHELVVLLSGPGIVPFESASFEQSEISDAPFCALLPGWINGYPEPRPDDFGYREVVYASGSRCDVCGVGARQVAPYRIKATPKWGRRRFMQLNWVFGEHFINDEAYSTVFADLGVSRLEVLDRRGRRLPNVWQLLPQAEVDVDTSSCATAICRACQQSKQLPYTIGFFPRIIDVPSDVHVLRTRQWFGSGGEAHQQLLVSRLVVSRLRSSSANGVGFQPVDDGSHGPQRKDKRHERWPMPGGVRV